MNDQQTKIQTAGEYIWGSVSDEDHEYITSTKIIKPTNQQQTDNQTADGQQSADEPTTNVTTTADEISTDEY